MYFVQLPNLQKQRALGLLPGPQVRLGPGGHPFLARICVLGAKSCFLMRRSMYFAPLNTIDIKSYMGVSEILRDSDYLKSHGIIQVPQLSKIGSDSASRDQPTA